MTEQDIVADITDDFKLEFVIRKVFDKRLREIGAGKRVKLEIKELRPRRTKKQNSYLWAVVYPMVCRYIKDTTGQEFTPEQYHERNKKKYLGYEICDVKGMEDLVRPKSSTELDVEEFWDQLVEHTCREWSVLGLFIPLPQKNR